MGESIAPYQAPSLTQYLELERDAPVRHEYVGGQLRAMTGASKRHNTIAGNVFSALRQAARGTSCRVYMSDVKVLTPGNPVYYPEVMVTCEPESSNPYVVSNPCPIVEVVSPETEAFDRREKWMACHTIPSLKAYLMVDQDSRSVDRAFRLSGAEWLFAAEVDDSELRLPCPPGVDLSLARICRGL